MVRETSGCVCIWHENTGSVLCLITLGYEVLSLHDVQERELEPLKPVTIPSIQVRQSVLGASSRLSESELHTPEQTPEPVGIYFPGAQPPHSPHSPSKVLHHEVTV